MTKETTLRLVGGPPTLNGDGNAIFRISPANKNGNISRPILSPLPTRALRFMLSSKILLDQAASGLPVNASRL
jgi:hypothetical protein